MLMESIMMMMTLMMILLSHSHTGDSFELCYSKWRWHTAMMNANFLVIKFSLFFFDKNELNS